jgi:phage shock protein PspC (stress-responsive transcriptional regulator)
MNKVITVNLNGNAYQLEETGYIALDEYLADAEAKLKNNPDLMDIIADLEQAIADKCNKHLTPGQNVITRSEIEQILNEMGRIEPDTGEGADDQTDSGAPKHLYRIREGAMIAGVCKGIAAYLNVDVTMVRLACGILAIASAGAVALAYFVAMIIIPPADTLEEHAEAYGLPFNAQELVDQAMKQYANFKKDAGEWWRKAGPGSADWKWFKRNIKDAHRETYRAARQARRTVRNASWSSYV